MTDRVPRPQTTQAATQTGPPLRDYRDELKAQIARAELAEQQHNDAIAQLQEQAADREAELKRLLAESSVALKAQEREVMNLQVAITEAKERFNKEEERNSRRNASYSKTTRNYGVNTGNSKKWQANTCKSGNMFAFRSGRIADKWKDKEYSV